MLKRLLRHKYVLSALAGLLARYLSFALNTTRWTLVGAEHFAPFETGAPVICAFWHEHLPLMPALWKRVRVKAPATKVYVLVSRHNDGRFIGDVVAHFGMSLAYGSSSRDGKSRGGMAAVRSRLEMMRAGTQVAITPDGPRGPRRTAAAGVAQLAAISGVSVLPCAARATPCKTAASWDKMILPLPFARGYLVCGAPIRVARGGLEAAVPVIEKALNDVAEEAEKLCRA